MPSAAEPPPAPAEIDAALAELRGLVGGDPGAGEPSLSEDEALRLSTELYEWKLDALYSAADLPGPADGAYGIDGADGTARGGGRLDVRRLRRLSPQERALREQLVSHYRQLAAHHRGSPDAHEHLVDLIQAVRPQTWI
jgi:serine/threonine-protein kinase PknG